MPRNYTSKIFTKHELKVFEETTFRNMVTFFREELEKISKGETAKTVLSKGDIRTLKKRGILELTSSGYRGRMLEITPRATLLLNQIDRFQRDSTSK